MKKRYFSWLRASGVASRHAIALIREYILEKLTSFPTSYRSLSLVEFRDVEAQTKILHLRVKFLKNNGSSRFFLAVFGAPQGLDLTSSTRRNGAMRVRRNAKLCTVIEHTYFHTLYKFEMIDVTVYKFEMPVNLVYPTALVCRESNPNATPNVYSCTFCQWIYTSN